MRRRLRDRDAARLRDERYQEVALQIEHGYDAAKERSEYSMRDYDALPPDLRQFVGETNRLVLAKHQAYARGEFDDGSGVRPEGGLIRKSRVKIGR
jgi:hypothetical protein